MLKAEGPTHLWLYKHVQRLAAWAPCSAVGQDTAWQQPPGWDLLQVFNITNDLKGYKLAAKTLPLVAVLRQSSTASSRAACRRAIKQQNVEHAAYINPLSFPWIQPPPHASAAAAAAVQVAATAAAPSSSSGVTSDTVLQQHRLCSGDRLIILVRGTGSAYEWTYNLHYSMNSVPSYGPGQIHNGFHTAAEEVWNGGLGQLLQQQLLSGAGGEQGAVAAINSVVFAGHSLGGAVGALLAAKTDVSVGLCGRGGGRERSQGGGGMGLEALGSCRRGGGGPAGAPPPPPAGRRDGFGGFGELFGGLLAAQTDVCHGVGAG